MSIHVLCQHGLHGHLLIHALNQSHAGKVQVPTKHHFINVAEDEMEDLPYQKILTKSEVPDIEIEINNLAPFMYNFFTRGVIRITPEPNEVMTKYKSHFKPLFPDLYDDWQNAYPDRFTIHDFEANPMKYIITNDVLGEKFFELYRRYGKVRPVKKRDLFWVYNELAKFAQQVNNNLRPGSCKFLISDFYDLDKFLSSTNAIAKRFGTYYNRDSLILSYEHLHDTICYDLESISSDGSVLSEFLDLKACSNSDHGFSSIL